MHFWESSLNNFGYPQSVTEGSPSRREGAHTVATGSSGPSQTICASVFQPCDSQQGKEKCLDKCKISLTPILNMNQENVSGEWNLAVCRLQWHEDGVGVSCRHSLNGLSYISRPVHSTERWNCEQILPYELGWHGNRRARFICKFICKRSRDSPLLSHQPESQPDQR